MIKQVINNKNLNEAYLRVYGNMGAAGVDRLQATDLKSTLKAQGNIYSKQM
ncbi:hypothetical protein [Maribacter spongiicola]|uniref:hypothetical protein n=1 Tax=Maribacter spongiicola TaxID=1206753 RepID=UPI003F9669F8